MRLLIIGTLNGYMSTAGKIALDRGAKVVHVHTEEEALASIRKGNSADLIFLEIQENIKPFIDSLKEERIHIPVITCGIDVNSKAAANSIAQGATDYIPLPPDAELISAVLEAISQEERTLIFADPKMGATLELAKKVAPSNASILITGASGTGKEVIAHFIHRHSACASKKFISVNCAAIPENLLESELFGHEKGAFTGAVARRIGKFEEADGGTLLLDEISEMHPRLQAKLLRAIQEREIDRVGGNSPIKINIRLLATSNRDLQEEVQKGTFREDLYFRLNVVNIMLPTLAERPGDIPNLITHFIKKYCIANGVALKKISPTAQGMLQNYSWPGNVRELENAIHRAILLSAGDTIENDAILLQQATPATEEIQGSAVETPTHKLVGRTVSDVERELIMDTLNHCLGNRTQAATILGISIRTLRNKLKQYTEHSMEVPLGSHSGKVAAYKTHAYK